MDVTASYIIEGDCFDDNDDTFTKHNIKQSSPNHNNSNSSVGTNGRITIDQNIRFEMTGNHAGTFKQSTCAR